MLHHGEGINQKMKLSVFNFKTRTVKTQQSILFCDFLIVSIYPLILSLKQNLIKSNPTIYSFIAINSILTVYQRNQRVINFSQLNMQAIFNETSYWTIYEPPLISPLFGNINTIISDSEQGAGPRHEFNQPVIESTIVTANQTISVNYWAFILIIFPLFTIVGNVMVVVSVYREKSLHTVTNYFVVSLAISDITVAAVVMPFAIYLEFNRVWELSERLCDFWVASDCMACTASILNLVAIAVDRYIAVTKPLKYARHKSPKRVAVMIVIVWLISFFIALPIVSGVNKSDVEAYPRVPDQCAFFNNKFLIFSSLGSFFIPCIIIFAIYYRIFVVIMKQARKTRQQWRPKAVIESTAAQHRSNADHLITSYYTERASIAARTSLAAEKTSFTLPADANDASGLNHTNLDIERNCLMLKMSTPLNPLDIGMTHFEDEERDEADLLRANQTQVNGNSSIDTRPSSNHSYQFEIENEHKTAKNTNKLHVKTQQQDSVDKNQIGKVSKRKAYSRMKKERKATQTLIIVLICFLVCWLPFFVSNNLINAIVKLSRKSPSLLITDFTLSLCVWLGYINSFLNPIIYTIFNLEFRKAFVKIIFSFCRLDHRSTRSA